MLRKLLAFVCFIFAFYVFAVPQENPPKTNEASEKNSSTSIPSQNEGKVKECKDDTVKNETRIQKGSLDYRPLAVEDRCEISTGGVLLIVGSATLLLILIGGGGFFLQANSITKMRDDDSDSRPNWPNLFNENLKPVMNSISTCQRTVNALQQEFDDFKSAEKGKSSSEKIFAQPIGQLNTIVAKFNNNASSIENCVKTLDSKVGKVESAASDQNESVDRITQRLETARQNLATSISALQESPLLKEVASVKKEICNTLVEAGENTRLKQQIVELQGKLNAQSKEIQSVAEIQNELQQYRQKYDRLENSFAALQQEKNLFADKCAKLNAEIQDLQAKVVSGEKCSAELNSVRNELEKVCTVSSELKQKLEDAEKQIQPLEQQVRMGKNLQHAMIPSCLADSPLMKMLQDDLKGGSMTAEILKFAFDSAAFAVVVQADKTPSTDDFRPRILAFGKSAAQYLRQKGTSETQIAENLDFVKGILNNWIKEKEIQNIFLIVPRIGDSIQTTTTRSLSSKSEVTGIINWGIRDARGNSDPKALVF